MASFSKRFIKINASLIFVSLLIFMGMTGVYAQTKEEMPTRLFRFSDDNDVYNVLSKRTDRAYTNGTQLTLFYTRAKPFLFFIDRLMPKTGDSSKTIAGWGFTQLMFTPKDIKVPYYQPNDYPFAGVLFISRSVYSYNQIKKYGFQSELFFGVRGPAALSEATQQLIHRVISVRKPMGWSHQLQNKPFANLSFKAEKELYCYNGKLEVIGGGVVLAGTMINNLGITSLVRFGKMAPYFKGIINQYSKSATSDNIKALQAYLFIKPTIIYNFYNGMLNGKIQVTDSLKINYRFNDKKINYSLDAGAVLMYKKLAVSVSQNTYPYFLQGLDNHFVSNFSLYYTW